VPPRPFHEDAAWSVAHGRREPRRPQRVFGRRLSTSSIVSRLFGKPPSVQPGRHCQVTRLTPSAVTKSSLPNARRPSRRRDPFWRPVPHLATGPGPGSARPAGNAASLPPSRVAVAYRRVGLLLQALETDCLDIAREPGLNPGRGCTGSAALPAPSSSSCVAPCRAKKKLTTCRKTYRIAPQDA